MGNNKYKNDRGLQVPVDLARLIERVYVSPKSPSWIAALIENILEKYEIDVSVHHSDLSSGPLY